MAGLRVRERASSTRPWSRSTNPHVGEDYLVYDGGFPSLKATVNGDEETRVRIPAAAPTMPHTQLWANDGPICDGSTKPLMRLSGHLRVWCGKLLVDFVKHVQHYGSSYRFAPSLSKTVKIRIVKKRDALWRFVASLWGVSLISQGSFF